MSLWLHNEITNEYTMIPKSNRIDPDVVIRTFRIPRVLYKELESVADGIQVSSLNHAVVLAIYRLLMDEPWHRPCNSNYLELVVMLRKLTYKGGVERGKALEARKAELAAARRERARLLKSADEPLAGEAPWKEDPVFIKAWKDFPPVGRRRSSSRQVWRIWRTMSVPDRMLIDRAIQLEKIENADWASGYVPGMHRWLKSERWRDLDSDFPGTTNPTRPTVAEEGGHDVF
jgi:hypothetical protein